MEEDYDHEAFFGLQVLCDYGSVCLGQQQAGEARVGATMMKVVEVAPSSTCKRSHLRKEATRQVLVTGFTL